MTEINVTFRKTARISMNGMMKVKFQDKVPLEIIQALNISKFQLELISDSATQTIKIYSLDYDLKYSIHFDLYLQFEDPKIISKNVR